MRYEVYEMTDDGRQLLLRTNSFDEALIWSSNAGDYILDTVTNRVV
jgi:hypothetical protein